MGFLFIVLTGYGWASVMMSAPAFGQAIEVQPDGSTQPEVGKGAARKYFLHRRQTASEAESQEDELALSRTPASQADRYLALHFGFPADDRSYRWGRRTQDDVGKWNAGVTYRIGEWVRSMDLLMRADFASWSLQEGRALKMSLLPLVVFPDANSGFPLYFGAGAGLGVFFKQLKRESALSFDYQILAGVRIFDVIESVGFLFEVGMKNHIHLLSDGQFNGIYVTVGSVFAF